MLCTLTALADDNLKVIALSEGVPHWTAQKLPSVLSNKGEFATKCAGASYCGELLQDRSFKLVKPIKFLKVNDDLLFFS